MHLIEEPGPVPSGRFALWELGFRPFYLLASIFAAVSIPLWSLQFSGQLGHAYLAGPAWHAHEMLFGFALAVIVGFLFTAGRNWSNQPTPSGAWLAVLAAWWVAARLLVLTPFGWAAALVNVGFPLAAAVSLALPLYRARNTRNYVFVGLLAALSVASGLVHLSQLGVVDLPSWAGLQLGLDLVLFILAVMAGRVIPMFTNNGVPGVGATRNVVVERCALSLLLILAAVDLTAAKGATVALLAAAACIAHTARWLLWKPWRTLGVPLVWVLQLAYLWVPVHLALRALVELGAVPSSAATHALAVGAVGGLIIGMMARTTRGHTGRPLRADRVDVACFTLVLCAAVVRVAWPLWMPAQTLAAIQLSALLWAIGFGLFAVRYGPMLARARVDGKRG